MYKEAVGRYGMAPSYFFERLGLAEAADFLEGAQKRCRDDWEQSRHITDVVAVLLGGKATGLKFAWEMPSAEEIEEQTEAAMAAAKAMEAMVESGKIKL